MPLLFKAVVLRFFLSAMIIISLIGLGAPSSHAADLYLQGGIGYSFLEGADYEYTTPGEPDPDGPEVDLNDPSTIPDPVVTHGGMKNDGLGNVVGMEFGIDNIGDNGRIRAGIGYQKLNLGNKKSLEGIPLDEANLVASSVVSANIYYFLSSREENPHGWRPYLGVGMGKIDVDPLGIDKALLFHLGVERSLNSMLSIGGRYSYMRFEDETINIGEDPLSASKSAIHLLSATLTYHLPGF